MGRIRVEAGAASAVLLLAVAFLVMVPIGAAAQSVAGVVHDTSGAVLPGVSIEASSPALIKEAERIFCPTEPSTLGMFLALKRNNLAGSKKLVGFDTSPGLMEGLEDGENGKFFSLQ